jgi:hypothetical protein
MSDERQSSEVYIGDGVSASLHAGMIKLRAPRSDYSDGVIYLEPQVAFDLVRYINIVWPHIVASAIKKD